MTICQFRLRCKHLFGLLDHEIGLEVLFIHRPAMAKQIFFELNNRPKNNRTSLMANRILSAGSGRTTFCTEARLVVTSFFAHL